MIFFSSSEKLTFEKNDFFKYFLKFPFILFNCVKFYFYFHLKKLNKNSIYKKLCSDLQVRAF